MKKTTSRSIKNMWLTAHHSSKLTHMLLLLIWKVFHPLCYLKRALFRLENYSEFSRFPLCGKSIGSKTRSVMPWTSQTFEIKSIAELFLRSRWEIRLDRLRVIIYIISLKEQLLIPYWSNTSLGLFCYERF